ncbi:MAG: Lar family restriction alleviation protein [Lachnospiraceae bacterium]|nr:Lar family restriction alleviation protein [Lachnospiraceae bacterium]MBR6270842.1 Lar family restriction alleviation protein [Lachnospiraceae bacterium]
MNPHEQIDLNDCPFCGGAGILEEEEGWCWYVVCADCGSQTAASEYEKPADRELAAQKAAALWNIGKVVRGNISE